MRDRRRFLTVLSGGSAPLAILDTFTRADGDLGGDWSYTSGLWTIASGAALGTPGLVGELFTNPGFEGTYVGGLAPDTTAAGTPTEVAEETTIVHGGTSSQKSVADGAGDGTRQAAGVTTSIGRLVRVGGFVYCVTARARLARYNGNTFESRAFDSPTSITAAWVELHGTLRIETALAGGGLNFTSLAAGTLYVDDVTAQLLTMADIYALREGKANATIKTTVFGLVLYNSYEYGGIAFRMDAATNPQTGYVAYHNGSQVVIEKLTSGLWAKVGTNANVTYVSGAELEVNVTGTTVTVYYNDVLVRTESITDYASNKFLGMVSSHPGVSFGYFQANDYG